MFLNMDGWSVRQENVRMWRFAVPRSPLKLLPYLFSANLRGRASQESWNIGPRSNWRRWLIPTIHGIWLKACDWFGRTSMRGTRWLESARVRFGSVPRGGGG